MRTLKKYLLFIVIAITVFACKKEHLPPSSNGSPIFYFNGNVNSAPVTFQAGVNNYYMYSSYALDSNNLLNFIGTLEPIGCNGCANTIKISINDYKVENNATVATRR